MRFATVKKADRTYDLPIATVRIVAAQSRVVVPTGRFELPHLAALAPQASVSTSSTTSAQSKLLAAAYFGAPLVGGVSGGAGAAGAAGAGTFEDGALGAAEPPGASGPGASGTAPGGRRVAGLGAV